MKPIREGQGPDPLPNILDLIGCTKGYRIGINILCSDSESSQKMGLDTI
jgi:hypothetical protein